MSFTDEPITTKQLHFFSTLYPNST